MITCPVCKNNSTKFIAPFRAKSPVFFGCQLTTCLICDMVFAAPMPSDAALSNYNTTYFSTAHSGKPSSPSALAFFSGIARLRIAFVNRFLDAHQIRVSRIFELGPGLGYFAKSWMEEYPASNYSVIETDSSCHKSLEALGIKLVEFSDLVTSDLVVMSHVLEHVSDPAAFINSTTRGLRKGGAIFIEVPCQDWKHKKLDEPHVLFFEKKSIQFLLNKLGFGDIQVSYYGQPISELCSRSRLYDKLMSIRGRLINWGFVRPFSKMEDGLEILKSPLERAIVRPFLAHRESNDPAWWLRVMAIKI